MDRPDEGLGLSTAAGSADPVDVDGAIDRVGRHGSEPGEVTAHLVCPLPLSLVVGTAAGVGRYGRQRGGDRDAEQDN
jgi:hypothetical protein